MSSTPTPCGLGLRLKARLVCCTAVAACLLRVGGRGVSAGAPRCQAGIVPSVDLFLKSLMPLYLPLFVVFHHNIHALDLARGNPSIVKRIG